MLYRCLRFYAIVSKLNVKAELTLGGAVRSFSFCINCKHSLKRGEGAIGILFAFESSHSEAALDKASR